MRAVADALRTHGLTVFIDERDLVAGRSLRGQIDNAILESQLGILFLSHSFFAKRWPREEFDALFSLESDGNTKMIPLLLPGTEVDALRRFSPILASRLALSATDDPIATAKLVVDHVERIFSDEGSWARRVRIDTLRLPWVERPMFFPRSLKMLDDHFPTFFNPNRPATELPNAADGLPLRAGELVMRAAGCDGRCLLVTGRQELVQLYESHADTSDVLPTEYVFQLRTNDPAHRNSIVYVRHTDFPGEDGALPTAPADHLTIAVGVVIALGAMVLSDGSLSNAAYMVAASVMHMPKLD